MASSSSNSVTRVAVIYCADWSAVAASDSSGSLHAVVHAQRVISCTPQATVAGVRIGMRRREAQGACPQLVISVHQPERDRRSFEPIVSAVVEVVPLVEVSEPGVIVFATRGPSRYMGGDDALAAKLHAVVGDALASAGVTAGVRFGVGIADGRLMASIAARSSAHTGAPVVVPVGDSEQALVELPVSVLDDVGGIQREVVSLLERLGLATLGAVAELSAATLVARFGPVGQELHRLSHGCDQHPPIAIAPPPDRACRHIFETPVEQSAVVVAVAHELAEQLVDHLTTNGVMCVRLYVRIESENGERSERVWYRVEGLSIAAMVERVRWQMDAFIAQNTLTSGIVALRLAPDQLRHNEGKQLDLWGGVTQADEWAQRAITRVSALIGSESVVVPEWCGGRDPGQAFVLVSAVSTDLERRKEQVAGPQQSWCGELPTPTPALVYDEPIAVIVQDDEGKPLLVTGRHELSASPATLRMASANAAPYAVVSWAGPWPVEERWWDPTRRRRLARLQLVITRGDTTRAVIVALEHGQWWLTATYG
ncbi:MAG: DNA polymerase Y family protein [Ilumatobacteraceae bacterium]